MSLQSVRGDLIESNAILRGLDKEIAEGMCPSWGKLEPRATASEKGVVQLKRR